MRLIMVRHGRTASNVAKLLDTAHPGAPLDEVGLAQADELVERLSSEPIEAAFSSDLIRAQQTLAPLAAARGLTPISLPGFREISVGEYEMSADAGPLFEVLHGWHEDRSLKLPGGESHHDFEARWQPALDEVEASGAHCAVVVSHGAAIGVWAPSTAVNVDARRGAWLLENTGWFVLEGSSRSGWTLTEWSKVVPPE